MSDDRVVLNPLPPEPVCPECGSDDYGPVSDAEPGTKICMDCEHVEVAR